MYRVSLWYPDLVSHIFSVCTPYKAPTSTFVPLEDVVANVPNWGYQIVLASGVVEEHIKTPQEIRQFLNALYGGKGEQGEVGFSVTKGPIWENLEKLGRTRLVGEEVLGWYVGEYERNGVGASGGFLLLFISEMFAWEEKGVLMRVLVNWYRNREVNFKDELQYVPPSLPLFPPPYKLLNRHRLTNKIINVPVLFIQATRDDALPPSMSEGMEGLIPNLTRREVKTGHWALWEAPEKINEFVGEWLEKVDQGEKSKL